MHQLQPTSRIWPTGFTELQNPPERLFVKGRLPAPGEPVVAIVGTRASTRRAEAYTSDLAADYAKTGAWVISGGALGIDAAAHRGALRAGGGTIVVQAPGLGRLYPKPNRGLFAEIVQAGGALVSESEADVAPHRGLFLRRNRLVAAWASQTIVVQAPFRSGALHTARIALSLSREVFVAQGSPWDDRHAGCSSLLNLGAKPLASLHALSGSADCIPPGLSANARHLLQFVESDDAQSADQLASRSHLEGAAASRALFELEMEGLVEGRDGLFLRPC